MPGVGAGLVLQVHRGPKVPRCTCLQTRPTLSPACPAQWGRRDLKAFLVLQGSLAHQSTLLGNLGKKVCRGLQELLGRKVGKAQQELLAQQALPGLMGCLACRFSCLESKVMLETKVLRDLKALLGRRDRLVPQAHRV